MTKSSVKGSTEIALAIVFVTLMGIGNVALNQLTAVRNRQIVDAINETESFYSLEILVWKNYWVNKGSSVTVCGIDTLLPSGRCSPVLPNQLSSSITGFATSYDPATYKAGVPLNVLTTKQFDSNQQLIRRYDSKKFSYRIPGANKYCGNASPSGAKSDYRLCLQPNPACPAVFSSAAEIISFLNQKVGSPITNHILFDYEIVKRVCALKACPGVENFESSWQARWSISSPESYLSFNGSGQLVSSDVSSFQKGRSLLLEYLKCGASTPATFVIDYNTHSVPTSSQFVRATALAFLPYVTWTAASSACNPAMHNEAFATTTSNDLWTTVTTASVPTAAKICDLLGYRDVNRIENRMFSTPCANQMVKWNSATNLFEQFTPSGNFRNFVSSLECKNPK